MSEDKAPSSLVPYGLRKVDYYIEQINASIADSLTPEQTEAVRVALESAIPKPSPKIVDLRINIDLIISKFYVVLFVGKDRRKNKRSHSVAGLNKVANFIAVVFILIGLNLTVSLFFFLIAYLVKSSVGINLFEGHLSDYL